jgi:tetratricopeptide (TPR) repeat protein
VPTLVAPLGTWNRAAAIVLAAWLLGVLATVLFAHPTPLYSVESDVIGEYVPAAQGLLGGDLTAEHYQSKGFGYPLALAAASLLARGDYYLAARLLNVAAAVVGACLVYALFAGFLGVEAGFFILVGLLLNPTFVRSTVEIGTDIPTFALLVAATFLLLRRGSAGALLSSGLLAGYAVITRYNSVFLPLAGILVLASRRGRPVALGAYLAGLAVPVGAWLIAARAVGGSVLGSQNVMNMAYEIYGRNLGSEQFWSTRASQFGSFWDVVRHDPAVFLSRIATNLATRWLDDAHQLLPVWLGALALPGMVLGWRGRPGWPGMAVHAALSYVVLVPIFYLPRFGLFLIPFYLSGVVALVLYVRLPPGRATGGTAAPPPGGTRPLRPVLLAALILASGWQAITGVRESLATAPHETREAGLLLRPRARPGDRIMARKPNVAYFAGMTYEPLPDASALGIPDLIQAARGSGTRYLFFSPAEANTRIQFGVLADSGVTLPGLEQIAFHRADSTRYYALYEFTGAEADPDSMRSALLAAGRRYAERHPREAWPHTQLGIQLLGLKRSAEALAELDLAQQLDSSDVTTAMMQELAHEWLGQLDAAAAACERAIRLGAATGIERARLGWIRIQQGRPADALAPFEDALRLDPGNADYSYARGYALLLAGRPAEAVRELERALGQNPGHVPARLHAARAWWLLGKPERALALLTGADDGGPGGKELQALADSIRSGLARRD